MGTGRLPKLRVAIAGAVMLVVGFGLAGCIATPRGGQSFDDATTQVESLPGVLSATVEESSLVSGFNRHVSIVVRVDLKEEAEILDKEAFVDFLFAVAWSANEARPDVGLMLFVDHRGSDRGTDWGQVAEAAGWKFASSQQPTLASVGIEQATERFGAWPGPVPEIPAVLLTVGTAPPAPSSGP